MLYLASTAHGQLPIKISPNQRDIQNRESALESLGRRDTSFLYEREKLVTQLELRNDFRKLQIVNNELMKRVFKSSSPATPEITGKEVRSSLGEIQKLAKRLRVNLALPEIKTATPASDLSLSPGLLLLDRAIMDFVDNPLFQHPKVFDADLAMQAGRDLSAILQLSDFLRKLTKGN
jgi:hypothetical protein